MGIKDSIEKGLKNVKDTLSESAHRSAADGEHAKRDVLGDEMTPGDKAKSVANEAKEELLAEYDATKRDIRKHT